MSWQPLGSDGETATVDPGTVTVGVTRSDGTVVVAAGTATGGSLLTPRTVALTAAQTATVDVLTATWKVSTTTVATTSVDVVGGFYFTSTDLRGAQPSLGDPSKDPTLSLLSVRDEVETFFESQLGISCVPRLSVVDTFSYGNVAVTGLYFLRAVRWARLWTSNTTYTDLDAAELAGFPQSDPGLVCRTSGSWSGRVQMGVEHGLDAPPHDVLTAAMRWARVVAQRKRAGTVERAQVVVSEGTYMGPRAAGTQQKPTGYEDIDEVLRRPGLYHPTLAVA